VVVFFGATLLRSALGFGEQLIAVPLLAFFEATSALLRQPNRIMMFDTVACS